MVSVVLSLSFFYSIHSLLIGFGFVAGMEMSVKALDSAAGFLNDMASRQVEHAYAQMSLEMLIGLGVARGVSALTPISLSL